MASLLGPANAQVYPPQENNGTFNVFTLISSQALTAAPFNVEAPEFCTLSLNFAAGPDTVPYAGTPVANYVQVWLLLQIFSYDPAAATASSPGPTYSVACGVGNTFTAPAASTVRFTWVSGQEAWYKYSFQVSVLPITINAGGVSVTYTAVTGGQGSTVQPTYSPTPSSSQIVSSTSASGSGSNTPSVTTNVAKPAPPVNYYQYVKKSGS